MIIIGVMGFLYVNNGMGNMGMLVIFVGCVEELMSFMMIVLVMLGNQGFMMVKIMMNMMFKFMMLMMLNYFMFQCMMMFFVVFVMEKLEIKIDVGIGCFFLIFNE